MATIRQLLNQKGGKVCSIGPDATVFDAVAKMAENDIGSLTVMEQRSTHRHHHREALRTQCCAQGQVIFYDSDLGDYG